NPNGAPAWAMWRHDQFHQGRLGAPIIVAAGTVAFSARDAERSGLSLTFVMPAAPEAVGRYDVYRASGTGATAQTVPSLPEGFERVSTEALDVPVGGASIQWTDASAMPGHAYRYLFVRRQDKPGDAFLAYGPFAANASSEAPSVGFATQNF